MADAFIDVVGTGKKLQTYENTVSGQVVHAEAVTLVDVNGAPLTSLAVTQAGLGLANAANSTTANLAAGGVFTGSEWIDTLEFPMLTVAVFASHASATDGLAIQYSADAITVHDNDLYTVQANNGQSYKFGSGWRYARVVYTNGATLTTTLIVQTILRKVTQKSSTHRIADRVNGQQDADLVCAVVKGAGSYVLFAGVSGAQVIPDGHWIIGISASSTTLAAGTITGIPGQSGTVQVPGSATKSSQKVFNPPLGTCIAATTTITFTSTDSYEVECLNLA